jgi:hypothetical protein
MPNTLSSYRVSLHEDKGDRYRILFFCHADDEDHAEEQALNAYPNGEILLVAEIDNEDYPDD